MSKKSRRRKPARPPLPYRHPAVVAAAALLGGALCAALYRLVR